MSGVVCHPWEESSDSLDQSQENHRVCNFIISILGNRIINNSWDAGSEKMQEDPRFHLEYQQHGATRKRKRDATVLHPKVSHSGFIPSKPRASMYLTLMVFERFLETDLSLPHLEVTGKPLVGMYVGPHQSHSQLNYQVVSILVSSWVPQNINSI